MSTSCTISILNTNNTIRSVYLHSDGYIEYAGAMLFLYYQDELKINELIDFGGISSIAKDIHPKTKQHAFESASREKDVCVFYSRERNEAVMIYTYESLSEYLNELNDTYNYIYDVKKKKWFTVNQETHKFTKLENEIKKINKDPLFINYFNQDYQTYLEDKNKQKLYKKLAKETKPTSSANKLKVKI